MFTADFTQGKRQGGHQPKRAKGFLLSLESKHESIFGWLLWYLVILWSLTHCWFNIFNENKQMDWCCVANRIVHHAESHCHTSWRLLNTNHWSGGWLRHWDPQYPGKKNWHLWNRQRYVNFTLLESDIAGPIFHPQDFLHLNLQSLGGTSVSLPAHHESKHMEVPPNHPFSWYFSL